ncbi:MAG: hypothetical protein M3Q49_21270 [Actinomycetota bacterium]|nr:hypothetical protein [Actinomycetota bacterium]
MTGTMMRKALALVAIAAISAAMTASVVGAHPGKGKAYGLDRQAVCHKPADETTNEETTVEETTAEETTAEETTAEETTGEAPVGETTGGEETTAEETGRTLYLPEPAIKAHLKHGDELGACGAEDTASETSSGGTTEPDSPKKNHKKHEERLSEHPKGKGKG